MSKINQITLQQIMTDIQQWTDKEQTEFRKRCAELQKGSAGVHQIARHVYTEMQNQRNKTTSLFD
jgi:formyltetrahydrofolate synthetase